MFRLIKLALYVGVGYALYQLFQGMDMGGMQQPQRQGAQRRRAGGQGRSHPQNMTGPGKGRRVAVDTGEETGGHTELVGRGVVR